MRLIFALFALFFIAASGQQTPPRPPGTLLLNMLIKNEADHLRRTLPKWAKIIDAWIIGVDDANTDASPQVIQEFLGHIPGQIVTVHFDGMGPTWSILVQRGIEAYPNITHGILADADFMPMKDKLDKMELDIRCSKHMYTIWTEDHRNERKMDWIYRNIPGAVVKRRTHQILEVPPLPNQEVFQTLIDLPVEEREGGYGDRTGTKNQRYIEFLEKDLAEYPNDTRTLYYLGYAHFDIYNQNKDHANQTHWDHLAKGVHYFKLRANTTGGNSEELWFALLKLGEIYERFYKDWEQAESFYRNCTIRDPERADAWFYLGQHFRLRGDNVQALPYLRKAALLPIPQRSLFQWHYLYQCLSKLEFGRAVLGIENVDRAQLKETKKILNMADCIGGDPGNVGELKAQKEAIAVKLAAAKRKGNEKLHALKKLLKFANKNLEYIEDALSKKISPPLSAQEQAELKISKMTYFNLLLNRIELVQNLYDSIHALPNKDAQRSALTCRAYRRATTPYLKFFKKYSTLINDYLDDSDLWTSWQNINTIVRATCR